MTKRSVGESAVLYFSLHDPTYPRNSRVRGFLIDVFETRIDVLRKPAPGPRISRVRSMLSSALSVRRGDYSVVILSEFSVQYAIFGWIAARRAHALFIVDFFVGLSETELGDFGSHPRWSFRGIIVRFADWLAAHLADACLTDTDVRATRFSKQYGAHFIALPVGAPVWARQNYEVTSDGYDVLYYGSYLPLHGVEVALRAISRLPPPISVLFVGMGPDREMAEHLVLELGLSTSVEFVDDLEPAALARVISAARLCLGVLGDSPKAREVIANKVWQSLSLGAVTLTRESPALSEIRDIAGGALIEVSDLTPLALVGPMRKGLLARVPSDGLAAALEAYVSTQYVRLEELVSCRLRRR